MSCPSECAGILGPSVTSRSIAPTSIFCSNPRPLTPRGPLCDEPGNDPREPGGSQHRTAAAAKQRLARVDALSAPLYLEHRPRVVHGRADGNDREYAPAGDWHLDGHAFWQPRSL